MQSKFKSIGNQLLQDLDHGSAFCRMQYEGQGLIVPVNVRDDLTLDDLIDIDRQKTAVLSNIDAFIKHKPYNHMLLWGARGTGKSSLLRAAFHYYQPQGLKLLQLACDDLKDIAFFIWVISKQKSAFMIYIDDLSFTENDDSYRSLKAVLDGSIAGMPHNIMFCITSNRRHLISESHQNNNAIHPEEDVEEHISLAERFGLRLSFHPLSQQQYLDIVRHWANKMAVIFDDNMSKQALQFSLARGSRSARVAEQFIKQIAGKR